MRQDLQQQDLLPYFLTITSAGQQRVVEALRPQNFVRLASEPGAIAVAAQCLANRGSVMHGGVCFADIRLARSNGPVAVLLEGAKFSKAITKQ